jgi:hypothetical protein
MVIRILTAVSLGTAFFLLLPEALAILAITGLCAPILLCGKEGAP